MARAEDISTKVMPRRILALALIFLCLRLVVATVESSQARMPASSISWTDVNHLQHSGKGLVLYEFRADWCEPCKRMETTVLANKQIANMIATSFVPVSVTDRMREEGKNSKRVSELQKKYHIFAFPTLVVVTPDGEAAATLVGGASALSTFHFLSRGARFGER